ncbi:hypothetical protein KSS87_005232 [Heliosperma pusillum]|nr:hypothetical protein KSS87_005232 [Heliosperma pusillum]
MKDVLPKLMAFTLMMVFLVASFTTPSSLASENDKLHKRLIFQNSKFSGSERRVLQSTQRRSIRDRVSVPPAPKPNTSHNPIPTPCC